MDVDITGSPYLFDVAAGQVAIGAALRDIEQRVELLRAQGGLTAETLRDYYGRTRFEQIAESNALEGSTLSVGETELAVMKGVTITGHDPGFSRDAQDLARALDELAHMARESAPVDVIQVKRLHELILGTRRGAGEFRSTEVIIRGSRHSPPRAWREVMDQMEQWEAWSIAHRTAPPVLRSAVLHAWIEHIHPFVDGNGRTGRAITNLELIRAGYPPIIIRRRDREIYLDALGRADEGDLAGFLELVISRVEDALRDLERAAASKQGYDLEREKLVRAQSNRLAVWNAGVHLLLSNIQLELADRFRDSPVEWECREFDQLTVENFMALCERRTVRESWAFTIRIRAPGMPVVERLAWAGVCGPEFRDTLRNQPGRPVLMWSVPNPAGFPRWMRADTASPGGVQLTIVNDRWIAHSEGRVQQYSPTEMSQRIVQDLAAALIPPDTL